MYDIARLPSDPNIYQTIWSFPLIRKVSLVRLLKLRKNMEKGARLPNKRGSCYCGSFQYELTAPFDAQLLCHCSDCRYSSGGAPNTVGLTKRENFKIREGSLNSFVKNDNTPRRYFCPICGTHIYAESPARPDHLVLKIGTLDDITSFSATGSISH